MKELIKIDNGQQTIDSRKVAAMMGKGHKELLRDIRGYCEHLGKRNDGRCSYEK